MESSKFDRGAAPGAPEELLFEDAPPKGLATARDSDWDPLPADDLGGVVGGSALASFELDDRVPPRPAPESRRPSLESLFDADKAPEVRRQAAGTSPAPARAAAPQALSRLPRPGRSPRGYLVPLSLLAGSAGVAAWLQFLQHNTVMAALAAAFGLVSTAFTWIWLRH